MHQENYLLKKRKPSVGRILAFPQYMEVKKAQARSHERQRQVPGGYLVRIRRRFPACRLFEEYRMDDAEAAVVVIGSSAGTGKDAVDALREERKESGADQTARLPGHSRWKNCAVALSKSCGCHGPTARLFRSGGPCLCGSQISAVRC